MPLIRDQGPFDSRALAVQTLTRTIPGSLFGAAASGFLAHEIGFTLPGILLAVVAGAAAARTLFQRFTAVAGYAADWFADQLFNRRTPLPRAREYAREEALVARSEFEAAAAAYESACAENPDDPRPHLRLARLLRDRLDRPEQSVVWFHRALAADLMAPDLAVIVGGEIVDLFAEAIGEPRRALPELARIAATHAGTPVGEWAADTLAEMKARLVGPAGP